MAVFHPANSGTSPMSGIYASLRQAQIIIPEILQYMDACPAVFKRVVIVFALLDLVKTISFSDNLLCILLRKLISLL